MNGDTITFDGYSRLGKTGELNLLVKNSNRYVLSKGKKIPLIFYTDLRFAFPNVAFTGHSYSIKFIGSKFSEGQVLYWDR